MNMNGIICLESFLCLLAFACFSTLTSYRLTGKLMEKAMDFLEAL
jgi:hypothetical protein